MELRQFHCLFLTIFFYKLQAGILIFLPLFDVIEMDIVAVIVYWENQ